jgi:hypothetical protein
VRLFSLPLNDILKVFFYYLQIEIIRRIRKEYLHREFLKIIPRPVTIVVLPLLFLIMIIASFKSWVIIKNMLMLPYSLDRLTNKGFTIITPHFNKIYIYNGHTH